MSTGEPFKMTGAQYQAAIGRLGLSVRGAGRRVFGSERTSRRWASDGPPRPVAIALALMIRHKVKPADIDALLAATFDKPARRRRQA
jgi:hypothetical protein